MSDFYKKVINWRKVVKAINEKFNKEYSIGYIQSVYRGIFKSVDLKKELELMVGPSYEK